MELHRTADSSLRHGCCKGVTVWGPSAEAAGFGEQVPERHQPLLESSGALCSVLLAEDLHVVGGPWRKCTA